MLIVRWLLELLVMAALVAGGLRLHADWHKITPPAWKWTILSYQGVVAANAVTLLWAITESRPLTWATAVLGISYAVLVLPLMFERLIPKPIHDSIEQVQTE
jgi:hypothetical protein